jgi:hypothetical protein
MKTRKLQFLITFVTAGAFLLPGALGEETAEPPIPTPSPSCSVPPSPPPTPRPVALAVYFRRPARIIPVYRSGGAAVVPTEDFEITEEVPWLTEDHLGWISYSPEDNPRLLKLFLNPRGKSNFREAKMGNVGRTMILAIDGTARAAVQMDPSAREDRIYFPGEFSAGKLKQLLAQIQYRTTPTPPHSPSPTPVPKKRFIVR